MKKISEVAMVLDGIDVVVNGIFYKPVSENMGRRYKRSFDGSGEVKIEPWRVITTNNTHRHFRLRNAKGCEVEYSLKDGCICDNMYSTVERAINEGISIFQEDIDNHSSRLAKADRIKESMKILKKKQTALKKAKPTKLPKKV